MAVNPWKYRPVEDIEVWSETEIDLSAAAVTIPFPIGVRNAKNIWGNNQSTYVYIVKEILIRYTEATPGSTDATYDDLIDVGKNSLLTRHHTYTIPASKAVADVDTIDQADFSGDARVQHAALAGDLYVRCNGGASGAGKILVGLVLSADYTQWSGFDPTSG